MTRLPRAGDGLGDGDGLGNGEGEVVGGTTDGEDPAGGPRAFEPLSSTKTRTTKAAARAMASPTTRSAMGKGRGERDRLFGFTPFGSLTHPPPRTPSVPSGLHQRPGSFY